MKSIHQLYHEMLELADKDVEYTLEWCDNLTEDERDLVRAMTDEGIRRIEEKMR